MTPPPTPVPRVMKTWCSISLPAPKRNSPQAAALASFSTVTDRPVLLPNSSSRRMFSISCRLGAKITLFSAARIRPGTATHTPPTSKPSFTSVMARAMVSINRLGGTAWVGYLTSFRILPSGETTAAAIFVPPMSTPMAFTTPPPRPSWVAGFPARSAGPAGGDGPAAEARLYLLQGAALRLGDPEVHEEPRHDAQHREQPERAGPPEVRQQQRERQGDQEVRAPVGDGGHAHRGAPYPQRVDLRDHQPEHRAEADRERRDVQRDTDGRQDPRRTARGARREHEAQQREAYDHADEPDQEQRPAARPVDDPDGEDRKPDVDHAHAEGGRCDGPPFRKADALQDRGRVVDDGVDARYLLKDRQPDAYEQGGPDVRGEQLLVADARLLLLQLLYLLHLHKLLVHFFRASGEAKYLARLRQLPVLEEPARTLRQPEHPEAEDEGRYNRDAEHPAPALDGGEDDAHDV